MINWVFFVHQPIFAVVKKDKYTPYFFNCFGRPV